MVIITKNTAETINFGKDLATKLHGGDIVLLNGDLGAGKTTLMKGLALGLGIDNEINSPTFTLMNIYSANIRDIKMVAHIDTYRLKDERELTEIGVEDYLGEDHTLTIIEWPEKIANLLQNKKMIRVKLESLGVNERKIQVFF
jgi:tRNA threonylcarbamoyladenosine biosynthesis protein TsaE